eukprot:10390-Heterococcus_DN1.PRE.1
MQITGSSTSYTKASTAMSTDTVEWMRCILLATGFRRGPVAHAEAERNQRSAHDVTGRMELKIRQQAEELLSVHEKLQQQAALIAAQEAKLQRAQTQSPRAAASQRASLRPTVI